RLVALEDLGVARHPAADRVPALGIRGDEPERLGRGAELARHLPRQVAEHVLLAGEVLVERRPRAPGELGDAGDAAPVVALLAEDAQGGVDDPLLGALAPRPDPRVGGE